MTTVIYHSADFDGIFCREIAKHFLGEKDVQYIGWTFGDAKIPMPQESTVYILDLSPECIDGLAGLGQQACIDEHHDLEFIVWIDHHKTAIEKWPTSIRGYRIDGVAACRLAWQWFDSEPGVKWFPGASCPLPDKQDFIDRKVSEPLAVLLAGEYDIWDKRDPDAEVFQYALRATPLTDGIWDELFQPANFPNLVESMLENGRLCQRYAQGVDADLVTYKSFRLKWEGLDFLCLNTGRFNSLTFAALDKPETGHDALLGFMWNGKVWTVSLYHAKHRTDLDLSTIAVKYGGGGHRGACGFTCKTLPFPL